MKLGRDYAELADAFRRGERLSPEDLRWLNMLAAAHGNYRLERLTEAEMTDAR